MNDTTLPVPPGGAAADGGDPDPRRGRAVPPRSSRDRRGRGKRPVRRGFGLHDWMTLCRSRTRDLARRDGAPPLRRDISAEEVGRHDRPSDGWVILRGKVYDVGPYLAYHPGGSEVVEGCLGGDATELFDRYHAWVNLEALIGPLLLGSLKVERRMGGIVEGGGGCPEETVVDDENDAVVPPANAAASASDDFGFAMPEPRPPKREPAASLLPPGYDDGEREDDAVRL